MRSTGAIRDGKADEISVLKTCVNDLVGVLALPSMWSDSEPNEIIKSLLDVSLRTLHLDFVFAQLKPIDSPIETIRLAYSGNSNADEDALRRALSKWLADDPDTRTSVMSWPAHGNRLTIEAFRLGTSEHIGQLVAGSLRSDFPSETERLVLNVAANQAAIGLQGARFRAEQRRIAKELDIRVDQQSGTIAFVKEALRKENDQRSVAEEDLRVAEARLLLAEQAATEAERVKKSKFAELQKRYTRLTPRERDVLPFVVSGKLSKQTAAELGTSEITVRVHRGRIMRKLQAQSLADLIRMADNLGIHAF